MDNEEKVKQLTQEISKLRNFLQISQQRNKELNSILDTVRDYNKELLARLRTVTDKHARDTGYYVGY